jgi:uncharacterized protein
MEFDWDEGNRLKCQKHGVSIAEIEEVFRGSNSVVLDHKHSRKEQRFIAVGTVNDRKLFVSFTLRRLGNELMIRPISARPMHRKEIAAYEKTAKKTSRPAQ